MTLIRNAACLLATASSLAGPIHATAQETEPHGVALSFGGLLADDAGLFSGGTPEIDDAEGALRDAKISLGATFGANWSASFVYDFADRDAPGTPIKNAFVAYGSDGVTVAFGNQKVPFSQQHLNPLPQLVFAERALPFALAPRRRTGVTAGLSGDRWQVLGGAFGGNINDSLGDGSSYALRATWAPTFGAKRMLHLGGAIERERPDTPQSTFGFPPETLLPGRPLVASGPLMGVNQIDKLNLELGGKIGPLTVQSEYHIVNVDRAGSDPSFHGGYVQAAWLLTGETRPYIVANGPMLRGVFGRPKVANPFEFDDPFGGGTGAVEVAGRLSRVDFRDDDLGGGEQWSASLGLNWFANDTLRMALNYIHTRTNEAAAPDEDVDALTLRTEIRF